MTIRGKALAAGAVAAGVALAVGGTAQAAPQDGPAPIGYTVTASNAVTDSITGVTGTFGTPAASVVGSTAVQVPVADPIQFGATDSAGAAITWSSANLPTGFALTPAGALTLPTAAVTAPASFTVKAAEGSAVAFATVSVSVGTTTGDDGVAVAPDTVALNAPWNHHGEVSFSTVPSGVAETLANGPAGAAFSNGVLSVGTAVPGDYKGVVVTATDAAGATVTETFEAVIRPVYPPTPPAPAIPRLSKGHAVEINSVREWVYFWQSGAASWDHFTIVGPGGINGHQGWVNGQLGLNAAWYSGLLAHHGYTVYYQPVEGRGSTTPVPGSHWGYVYFVS